MSWQTFDPHPVRRGGVRSSNLALVPGSERRRSRAAGSVLKLAPVPLTNAEWK